jgi:hypothetical protein
MRTIKQLSHDVYYSMEKYSQIVIDLVENFEDAKTQLELGALAYQVDILLEVIDKSRTDDVEALSDLQMLIIQEELLEIHKKVEKL